MSFSDSDDGGVQVKIEFDPPIDMDSDGASPAQICLLEKWGALCEMEDREQGERC